MSEILYKFVQEARRRGTLQVWRDGVGGLRPAEPLLLPSTDSHKPKPVFANPARQELLVRKFQKIATIETNPAFSVTFSVKISASVNQP